MSEMTAVLIEAADRIFSQAQPWPAGGFDAPLWERIAEAGLDRLLLPEDKGGSGEAYTEAVALATRLGARAAAVPLIDTVVANWCLAQAGLEVPDGPKALLIAVHGGPPALDPSGLLTASHVAEVGWEPVARARVVLARHQGKPFIACVEAPLDGEAAETIAGEPLRRVTFPPGGIHVTAAAPWPAHSDLPLALLALLKAAALAGAAETVVGMAIEYANLRVQFGRPIAAFQAIQHMIARMAAEAAATAAAVQHAGMEFGKPGGVFAAAVAKGRASEAVGKIAASAHQVHGAIGFTAEHSLHRFTRRLWSWREDAGDEGYWYERIGNAAFRAGEQGLWTGITHGLGG